MVRYQDARTVNIWWVGAIIGILFGLTIGMYIASLATVIFEWAAQTLIAQGEIISLLNK